METKQQVQLQQQHDEQLMLPEWLDQLLRQNFFTPCSFHFNFRKNEKNEFCLDCHDSLCSQCVLSHSTHRLLQVRRYVYHDVVRLQDVENLIDCSHIQPYVSNGAKVVYLNQRPTCRLTSHSGNVCGACDRICQTPYLYCCISCKVDYVLENEGLEGLHGCLRRCETLKLNDVVEAGGVDGLVTPDSVLEPSALVSVPVRSSSNSSGATATNAVVLNATVFSTAGSGTGKVQQCFPRKKRTPKFVVRVGPVLSDGLGGVSGCDEMQQNVNRRKRVPQRSALV